jgi:ABC-type uncharacterized transport system YnjBCD ATPase subunit
MNVASVASAVTVGHAAVSAEGLPEKIGIRNLEFFYGESRALKGINLSLYANKTTAFIGPSGCGKSTLLRILNRMYDLYPGQRATGQVLFDGENLLDATVDINLLRARIGMVFQKPTPFPMSIYENIAFGIRLYERLPKSEIDARVESALRRAALWDEVHRPHRRGEARGHPVRRALLGARSDLDRQDRGADRRAEAGLHDRDRDAQHAAGGARLGFHDLHVSRRADRDRPDGDSVHDPP